jgi:hypothetical protein
MTWRVLAITTVLVLLLAGTLVNYVLIARAVSDIRDQAAEGQRARTTQCRVFPISIKLYEAAAKYHLITARDLATYRQTWPLKCPRAK